MGKAALESINVLRKILETACTKEKASLSDLTVLSAAVDPYRLDTDASHRDGGWLAAQLNKLCGSAARIHWRGLHYAIVQEANIKKPNGEIYRNTEADWIWLSENAGKAARWLGYIPFERIIDARNAAPIIHRKPKVIPKAHLSIGLDIDVPDAEDIEPLPIARGFVARQAYQFAIFGEKSSLEDIAAPIARQFEADLYLPTGEISDTLVYQIAKDANADGRPLVMFTLSDCDPAGHQMPISIARKLQAFKDLFFRRLEFEVVPVALTVDQVKAERLPSVPMKETEKRADRWRDAFGIDQTEIDALTTPTRRPILERFIRQQPSSRTSIRPSSGGWPTPRRNGTPRPRRRSMSRSIPNTSNRSAPKPRPSLKNCARRSSASTNSSTWPPTISSFPISRCPSPRSNSTLVGKPWSRLTTIGCARPGR